MPGRKLGKAAMVLGLAAAVHGAGPWSPIKTGDRWIYDGTYPSGARYLPGGGLWETEPDGSRVTFRSRLILEVTGMKSSRDSLFWTVEVRDSVFQRTFARPSNPPGGPAEYRTPPDTLRRETRTYLEIGGYLSRVLGRRPDGRLSLDTLDIHFYRPSASMRETQLEPTRAGLRVKEVSGPTYYLDEPLGPGRTRRARYLEGVGLHWGVEAGNCNQCGCGPGLELKLASYNGRAVDGEPRVADPRAKEAAEAKVACSIRRRKGGGARFRGGAVRAAYEVDLAGRITILPEAAP